MSETMQAGPELNALVAEKVMGEVEADAPCGDGLTRTDSFSAPTMAEANRLIGEAYHRHVERGMPLWPAQYIGPEYSTDVAADYAVHEKACTWIFSKRRAYFLALDELIQAKTGVTARVAWPEALQFYRVGDYSRAALKAVGAT